jgi:hypothetical protein
MVVSPCVFAFAAAAAAGAAGAKRCAPGLTRSRDSALDRLRHGASVSRMEQCYPEWRRRRRARRGAHSVGDVPAPD